MNDERFQRSVGAWLRDEDPAPPDSLQSARQVAARLPLVRQQGRWWPLPLLRRTPPPTRPTDTTAYQPSPVPATNGHTPTVIGRTQTMFSPAKAITVAALVFLFGGAMLIAQPTDQTGGSVPGAVSDPVPVDPSVPVGVIAIGSWGLTGAGSDPDRPPQFAVPENSWATGTNPEIDSIYQRLVAVRPETEGHVSNQARAEGGARSNQLAFQAEAALEEVPAPALVIIDIIGSDIRCDGTDEAFVPQFGEYLSETLDVITSTSPESRILMVDLQGRPATFAELLMDHPEAIPDYSGTGMCDYFDPEGQLVPEALDTDAGIIAAYEAEQARVCGEYPQCRTDGGVMAAWVDEAADYTSEFYLSVEGTAHKAEMLWPVVAEILELPS